MNTIIFQYRRIFLLCLFSITCLLSCTPDESYERPLSMDELEGYWIVRNWNTGTLASTLKPITIQFTSVNRSATFQDVPNNTWGYTENEIVFRSLEADLSRDFAIRGQMLIKEENSPNQTWENVTIIGSTLSEELYVKVNCNNCFQNTLILLRK